MSISYNDVVAYVSACEELSACIEADIKANKGVTTKTVLALNKKKLAAKNLKELFDKVEQDKVKLN